MQLVKAGGRKLLNPLRKKLHNSGTISGATQRDIESV